jgi:hypothetical protein
MEKFYAWYYIMRNILTLKEQILEVFFVCCNQDININGEHEGNRLHRKANKKLRNYMN